MLNKQDVEMLLNEVNERKGIFGAYNEVFNYGYKTALLDVLERMRPIAIPAANKEVKLKK